MSRNVDCFVRLGWIVGQDYYLVSLRLVACLAESCSFGYDSKDLFPPLMSQVVQRTRIHTGGSSVNGSFH